MANGSDYEVISANLMKCICAKKPGERTVQNIIVELKRYHNEELVREVIDKYSKQEKFYNISNGMIILTSLGEKECKKQYPGAQKYHKR